MVDYQGGVNGLPSANVVEFDVEGGNKVIVRPSGTEPKIKLYVFAKDASREQPTRCSTRLRRQVANCCLRPRDGNGWVECLGRF